MKTTIITKMIVISLMTMTLVAADTLDNLSTDEMKNLTAVETIYQSMSTAQLQKEIERRSIKGEVSFEMGIELMKRWANS